MSLCSGRTARGKALLHAASRVSSYRLREAFRLTASTASTFRVAMVFQSPQDQIVAETAELDVAFGPENIALPREEMHSRVASALDLFSLLTLAKAPTGSLTSGQKQHLALAGVHAMNPSLLVLDEPTSMLAPLARESLLSYLARFRDSGGTILHVTHDLDEASRAGRIIVLDDGRLAFDGTPRKIFLAAVGVARCLGLAGKKFRASRGCRRQFGR